MKRYTYLILGIILMFLLAACGNDDSTSNSSAETSDDSNEETTEEPAEEIILRIAWWGEQNRSDYTLEVIEMFEEQNPGITIEPEYAGWDDYWRKLAPQAAANELPDIMQMDLSYIAEYSSNNQLADLTPYIGVQINVDNIEENVLSGGELNDGMYGFNLGTTAFSYYYNPELVEEAELDLSEDWTWEDFETFASNAAAAGYSSGASVEYAHLYFDYYLRSQGERFFSEDGTSLAYEDDQLFVDFFTMQKELIEKGAGVSPDEAAQQTGPEDSPFVKGEALGKFGWVTQFPSEQQLSDLTFDIHNPPESTDETKGLFLKPSMFFSVAENSEHKEAAAKFIDFFVNDIEANKAILADRGIPVSGEVREALKEEVPEAQSKVFNYIQWVEENSSPMGPPEPKGAGEVIDAIQRLAEQVIYGEVTAEKAAENLRAQADSILSSN